MRWHERTDGLITAPPPAMRAKSHLKATRPRPLSHHWELPVAAHNACNLKRRLNPNDGHSSCLPQLAGVWLAGGRPHLLYPKQHGEVYLFLLGPTAFHQQRTVSAGLSWQVGCGKQAWSVSDYCAVWAGRREARTVYVSTHTSTWTHGSALPSPNFPPRKPSSASF